MYLTGPTTWGGCSGSGGRAGRAPVGQDGAVEEKAAKRLVEGQRVHQGILQEERPPDAVRLCRGDGLHSGIPPEVAEPVNTGTDYTAIMSSDAMWSFSALPSFLDCGTKSVFGVSSLPPCPSITRPRSTSLSPGSC